MNRKLLFRLMFVCVVLALLLLILYSGFRVLESTVFLDAPPETQAESKTIEKAGVKYFPRKDMTVLMLMGINREGKVQPTAFNHGGAVDMVNLVIFDEEREQYHVLSLNRDMMVNMPALNQHGKAVDTYYGQLAYAHTYGDGMAISCENVRKTVSDLLYGLDIDYYLAMNMDTIGILNDAVGGVTVEVTDDFSGVSADLPMGTVKLTGDQAVTFVQARWGVGDQLNLSRMARQKEYMEHFMESLGRTLEKQSDFAEKTYGKIVDFVVTDCTVQILSRLEKDYRDYTPGRFCSVEGENVLGEEYYEFYPDADALDELILDLFYAPKD